MEELKKIGELSMKYRKIEDNVLYYDLEVEIMGIKRKILLPRYHAFLGWIEILGFPPQNEWCVLKQLNPFEKRATLKIDEASFEERVIFNPDFENKMHSIITIRKGNNLCEYFQWFEDFSKAPEKIEGTGIFTHNQGIYRYFYTKRGTEPSKYGKFEIDIFKFLSIGEFPNIVRERVDGILKDKGKPDSIWAQKFEAKGALPPIYYKMFPIKVLDLNLRDCKGNMIQLGYLNKEGGEIDKIHGKWYKFFMFENDSRLFFIKEGGWSSKEIEIDGKIERIKNTYKKELFLLGMK